MNAEDFIALVSNCILWTHERHGRSLASINYTPNDQYSTAWVIISERGVGSQVVYSAQDELDVVKAKRKQNLAEIERLQKELADA